MLGLQAIDLFIVLLYLVGITVIGVWTMRKVHNTDDFFMPRRFGKFMMLMFTFGTGTHGDQAVSVASKTYTNGLSGIWYQWLWLFATPFYWLIAPLMRRFRAITTADVFELRYDRSVAMLFALVGCLNLTVSIGVMLKGAGSVIDASTGGVVSSNLAILLMTMLFVTYGVAGGLSAAIVTDFIQGLLTIVLSFMLLPFILRAVGGMSGLHEAIHDPSMFSLVAPDDIGIFYVAMIAFNGLVGIVTQPHTMANCAAGRTEKEGQIGFMGGSFVKRICTIAWCLTGLAAVAYYEGSEIDPDLVFGQVARDFLPQIMPGMLGLFLASVLASVMSSCDAFMISSSGLFVENIYKRLVPTETRKHYLFIARVVSFLIVAGGVAFAYWLPGVVAGLEIFWKIAPMMGIAFWLGLFWRRATVAGAWASTLTAFAVWWLSGTSAFIHFFQRVPFSESARFVVESGEGLAIDLPWQMVFYLAAGLLGGVIVSLLTKPVSENKLETYYSLIRTPIQPGESVPGPCTLPDGVIVPPRRVVFPNSKIEIPIPTANGITGFLIGWLVILAIMGSVVLIARI